jgi:tRNA-intron lyase
MEIESGVFDGESVSVGNRLLSLEEAYFSAFALGRLQILDRQETPLTLEKSWNLFQQSSPAFPIRYAAHHHFRAKGWLVTPGIKFGGDLLLYEKGPAFNHAGLIVKIESKNLKSDWCSILSLVRLAAAANKVFDKFYRIMQIVYLIRFTGGPIGACRLS